MAMKIDSLHAKKKYMSKRSFIEIAIVVIIATFLIYAFYNQSADKGMNNIVSSSKEKLEIKQLKDKEKVSIPRRPKVVSSKNKKSVRLFSQDIVEVGKADYIADLEYAVNASDEAAIQTAIEAIAGCLGCIERMIEILSDPSYDEKLRQYVAKALIKSGTGEGAVAVLRAIVGAHYLGQYDFKDRLMQIFADLDSVDAADTLAAALTGDDPSYGDLVEMPDDVQYAVAKAIRNISDSRTVGEMLAKRYKTAVMPEARERLMDINHADMNALLAADAYRQGDINEAAVFVERLVERDDPAAMGGMMLLAREASIPVNVVAQLAYQWMEGHPDTQNHDFLIDYLSNFDSTAEEKAVAAYTLAAIKDSNEINYALRKAYTYEEDPLVRSYIEAALTVIKGKSRF